MDLNYAEKLIKETENNYNLLARDYDRTRAFVPADIKGLAECASSGERVLDSGCANGRLFGVLEEKGVDYFGIDISEKLIEIAQKNYPRAEFQVVNALNLPFSDGFFDKVFSISVLHNIPSQEFQTKYLKEIRRVLKPGGLLILRVWDFWRKKQGWLLFLKYSFLKLIGKSRLDFYDIFVPWKSSQGEVMAQRYFHCFTVRNIVNLVKGSGFKVRKLWREGKDPRTNIYIIAEK